MSRAQPRVLQSAQIVANVTGISAVADVTGLSVQFTAPSRPVWVELYIAQVLQQTSTGQPTLYITDSSNAEVAKGNPPSLAAGAFISPLIVKRRLTILTPGTSYTFKARAQTSAGTVDVRANVDAIPTANGGPSYLRVFEE